MKNKAYVQIDNENYIVSWSTVPCDNHIEIELVDKTLFGALDYIQLIDNQLTIDEGKKHSLLEDNALDKLTDIEKLQKENDELKNRLDMSESSQLETLDMLFAIQNQLKGGDE